MSLYFQVELMAIPLSMEWYVHSSYLGFVNTFKFVNESHVGGENPVGHCASAIVSHQQELLTVKEDCPKYVAM